MSATFKFINEKDPSSCQRSLIIHDLPLDTKFQDLCGAMQQHLTPAHFHIEFGEPYSKGSEQRKRAYVSFQRPDSINPLMKARPILLNGKELLICRMIPTTYTYHGHITSSLAVQLASDVSYGKKEMELVQQGLERHFQPFGTVLAREWIVPDPAIVFAFDDYDTVDQLILAHHPPMIQQFRVYFSKTLRVPQNLPPSLLCTHLLNLPGDVTSRELVSIYGLHPADILLKPPSPLQHLDRLPAAEAWIKGASHPSKTLRGVPILSKIVEEPIQPVQLCRDFRQGRCRYLAGECLNKHVLCSEPASCENFHCIYGHYFSLRRRYVQGQPTLYRLKLSHLPSTITKEDLKRLFPSIDPSSFVLPPNLSATNVVYIVNQTSTNFLRNLIDQCSQFECQLETNESFFDWTRPVDIAQPVQKASVPFKPAPWYKPTNSAQ